MKVAKDGNLTKQDLAARWQVSIRSVERLCKRYQLMPCDWHGRQPEFHPADVAGMERRRRQQRLETNGYTTPARVVTVKEAKRLARKGGRR